MKDRIEIEGRQATREEWMYYRECLRHVRATPREFMTTASSKGTIKSIRTFRGRMFSTPYPEGMVMGRSSEFQMARREICARAMREFRAALRQSRTRGGERTQFERQTATFSLRCATLPGLLDMCTPVGGERWNYRANKSEKKHIFIHLRYRPLVTPRAAIGRDPVVPVWWKRVGKDNEFGFDIYKVIVARRFSPWGRAAWMSYHDGYLVFHNGKGAMAIFDPDQHKAEERMKNRMATRVMRLAK